MKEKVFREVKSIGIIVLIAFTLKATIIEAYIVPTGSMENTIMTGDFLIGSKFVFGMRTPEWVGIPYTDIGVKLPYVQFPEFREPEPGNVIIFKYPRDTFQKYVKRCVAGPGDTVQVINKQLYVNGTVISLAPDGKFVALALPATIDQPGIFLNNGNRDYFGQLPIPQKGDVIAIDENTNWENLVQLMVLDGHEITLEKDEIFYRFTMFEPQDVIRRKKRTSPQKIMSNYYPEGELVTPWSVKYNQPVIAAIHLDGQPIDNITSYTVEQNYFWMMGDNRDDSADSRYWGYVPRNHILGEALFSYMSIDFNTWLPRLSHIGRIIR